jgi:hypothetical protein
LLCPAAPIEAHSSVAVDSPSPDTIAALAVTVPNHCRRHRCRFSAAAVP